MANSPRSIPITVSFGELFDLIFRMDGIQYESVTLEPALKHKVVRCLVEHGELDDIVHIECDTIWRKEAWLLDVEHHKKERIRAERDRLIANKLKEACSVIVKHMNELTSFVDPDDMEMIAMRLLSKRDKSKLVKFGLDGPEWAELYE
jgi:hypothetical protein